MKFRFVFSEYCCGLETPLPGRAETRSGEAATTVAIQTAEWIAGGRAAIELLRSARTLLPAGRQKQAIATGIDGAEFAPEGSHGRPAKDGDARGAIGPR